ncbi:hypothetical protein [Nonomuraea typhae]|uniref:Uncharacterized protein n=1 Tax=Nonomuraea typhae TaxID=2603600 RepID=A0ABW7Z902_9ACTN
MRKKLGDRFVTVGTTFGRGGYNYTRTATACQGLAGPSPEDPGDRRRALVRR